MVEPPPFSSPNNPAEITTQILSIPPSLSKVILNPPTEQDFESIPLNGPLSLPEAEISGMAWFGDYLILLPQYPSRFPQAGWDGSVFALQKSDILAFIDGSHPGSLNPIAIPFKAPGLQDRIFGFEGFEAIAFSGERAYFTIESHSGAPMMAFMSIGKISADLSQLAMDTSTLVAIPPQTLLPNYTEEAMFISGDKAITLYEVNGKSINADPVAHRFDPLTRSLVAIPFPNLEYRITDATDLDSLGRFWVINTFTPKDSWLATDADPITDRFSTGGSHSRFETVERLIELQYTYAGITLTDTPPIQIKLDEGKILRNWEALARLDQRGFLIMTDKNPKSIFAFVPIP